ncbi:MULTISPECIES: oligosaccharide flippase family protein [Priestia]|uniref:oligosaccharide flippase family protein n=1 Tax=Priestia TaxID=2800373 RepID=UPI00265AF362|nr:oligosaccharide flippase family protein [Priestia aryabhattai]WKG29843.1 oligosaccharide flippase family protein [Priestia aryabhattai]
MKLDKLAVSNIIQMGLVQGLNYILPIIMIPYLLRVIGIENYGRVATALAIVQFLLIISDYGFNFTATQKIAVKEKVDNTLVSTIYTYKLILSGIILLITVAAFFFITMTQKDLWFVVGFYLFFLGQSFLPVWLFRGLNKMVYVSFITFFSKCITIVLLFLYVKQKEDFYLMGFVYGIPAIIGLIISAVLMKKYGIKFVKIRWNDLREELDSGKDMFFSNVIGTLYTTLNPIILTQFAGLYATGLYSTCEKIISVANSMTNAVSQAVYPIVCKKMSASPYVFLKKVKMPVSFLYFGWWPPILLIVSIFVAFQSEWILQIVNGSNSANEQITLLQIMLFIPFAISLGHLFGIQTLLAVNEKKSVRNSIFRGAILNLILGTTGSLLFGALGMGVSVLICEFVVGASMFQFLRKYMRSNKKDIAEQLSYGK